MRIITVELTEKECDLLWYLLMNERDPLLKTAEECGRPDCLSSIASLVLKDAVDTIDVIIDKLEQTPNKKLIDTTGAV